MGWNVAATNEAAARYAKAHLALFIGQLLSTDDLGSNPSAAKETR